MPGRIAQERIELSRIGGLSKALGTGVTDEARLQGEREARARLAALQTRRRLHEAVEAYALAERDLRELGLEMPS